MVVEAAVVEAARVAVGVAGWRPIRWQSRRRGRTEWWAIQWRSGWLGWRPIRWQSRRRRRTEWWAIRWWSGWLGWIRRWGYGRLRCWRVRRFLGADQGAVVHRWARMVVAAPARQAGEREHARAWAPVVLADRAVVRALGQVSVQMASVDRTVELEHARERAPVVPAGRTAELVLDREPVLVVQAVRTAGLEYDPAWVPVGPAVRTVGLEYDPAWVPVGLVVRTVESVFCQVRAREPLGCPEPGLSPVPTTLRRRQWPHKELLTAMPRRDTLPTLQRCSVAIPMPGNRRT